MAKKIRPLKAMLEKAGFVRRSSKGSHTIRTHPNMPDSPVVLSGNDGRDTRPYQEKLVREAIKAAKKSR
ncbi:MAG TPA: type II toxin-antitoxin system HicA family toxin [Gemmataceae bacterium]|nr:type II toxin-antitoxin system HicA family toxin [Gemmataceae bacterium]